jgi:hypothetical protein
MNHQEIRCRKENEMLPIEMAYLIHKERERDFIEQAEQARLITALRKDQSGDRRMLFNSMVSWIRSRFPKNDNREETPGEQQPFSASCCPGTEAYSR